MRKITSFWLVLCMICALTACGGPGQGTGQGTETEPAASVDTGAFKTMGDVFAYESSNEGCNDRYYVYAFEIDGTVFRAVAELPADVSEAIWAIDFQDETREQQVLDLVSPLEITQLDNLTEGMPTQEELDKLAGTNLQDLVDQGWTFYYWNPEAGEYGMNHGPYSFQLTCEGSLEDPENFDESQAGALTVTSVVCEGAGNAAGDILDREYDGGEDGAFEESGIDYLALVNKLNPLPEGWEDALETVTVTNSVGDQVEVEAKAFEAYEMLRADLEENDGIYTELDSARRSVAAQQDIMDRFIEKYGADYAAKTVAQPGYSEHHTGLALDLYFKIKGEDGSFTDVYYNEDMEKPEYKGIWDAIHAKLADYGFILRYLEGEEHITGYRYEPWHIRYVDDPEIAREIMSEPGMTLEEYLAGESAPDVAIDLSGSSLYTDEELRDAMLAVKCKFAAWAGCELHAVRYAGDDCASEENLAWLNSLEKGEFTQVMELLMDFHTGDAADAAFNADYEYTDYQWWLGRTEDGSFEIVSWGY